MPFGFLNTTPSRTGLSYGPLAVSTVSQTVWYSSGLYCLASRMLSVILMPMSIGWWLLCVWCQGLFGSTLLCSWLYLVWYVVLIWCWLLYTRMSQITSVSLMALCFWSSSPPSMRCHSFLSSCSVSASCRICWVMCSGVV